MNVNFSLLVPEYVLVGVAFAVLTVDFMLPRRHRFHLSWLAAGGLVLSAVVDGPKMGYRRNSLRWAVHRR